MATATDDLETVAEETGETAGRLVDTLAVVSADAGQRVAEVAGSARQAVSDADRALRDSSDQTLVAVASVSAGAAAGLLIAGSPRALILAALVPAVIAAAVVMDRLNAADGRAASRPK